jgi:hypothetical protein
MTARDNAPKSWSDAPTPAPMPATPPTYTVDHRLAWARLGRLAFSSSPPSLRELLREAGALLRHHAIERCRGSIAAATRHIGAENRVATRAARPWVPTMSADVQAWVSPAAERGLTMREGQVALLVPAEAWPLLAGHGLVRITVEPHDS